ncbi:MAG: hypothetical protein RL339_843 [Pseudomonadota bacterium]|jgi:hypothetical protein
MVDYFALALSHGLLVLAVWHLAWRRDLDEDPAQPEPETVEPAEPRPSQPGLRIRA